MGRTALLWLQQGTAEDTGEEDRKGRTELGTTDLGLKSREPSHQ